MNNRKSFKTKFALLLVFSLVGARMSAAENPLPLTGVTFSTTDTNLQKLYNRSEAVARHNIIQFNPTLKILVEGGDYPNCYLETQPMGGEMYAARDAQIALNNQLIFLLTQRKDGRLPGMVSSFFSHTNQMGSGSNFWNTSFPDTQVTAHYGWLQGFCFPEPAWRTYFWIGKDRNYLLKLYAGLAAFDDYLWRTRESNHDGVLETWCIWDLGEDYSTRHMTRGSPTLWPFDVPPGYPGTADPANSKDFHKYWNSHVHRNLPSFPLTDVMLPFQSMDMMAYSFDARMTLAKISRELGNGKEKFWQEQAEQVRQKLVEKLWDKKRHACFDLDKNGKQLPELIHNNLRAMYHGIFTQTMTDEFIKYHLLNTNEFWTKVPLPSIAVNESLFRNSNLNDWSGQSETLTYQRAIRALENYSHYSLVTELGQKLFAAVQQANYRFTEQFDPLTGDPGCPRMDGYRPTALALLEYISRMHGIHLDVVKGQAWWSACDGKDFSYSQRWGERTWTMTSTNGVTTASLNGKNLITCTAGVRVVTDLDGKVSEIIGISAQKQKMTLEANGYKHKLSVKPDQTIAR
ncbi:MAG: trehalase family glycosidase [Verrucomicrobiota bacterium]